MCNKKISNNNFHKGFYEIDEGNNKMQSCMIANMNIPEIFKERNYFIRHFLHGMCHIFAYVLHKKFGYDILEIKNISGSCVHWCCVANYDGKEIYIDVRGMTTNYQELLQEYQPDIGKNPTKSKITNLKDYDDEWVETEIKFANEIITTFYDYYSIKCLITKTNKLSY